jgi:co-chaperonin GroES (HSP10)
VTSLTSTSAAQSALEPIPDIQTLTRGSAPQLKSELGAVNTDTELVILPDPVGWRMLIALPTPAEMTAGGIIIPIDVNERERAATVVGRVLAMGDLCYKDARRFRDGAPWCKLGDVVLFSRYSGMRFKSKDPETGAMVEYRMLNDDEIVGTVPAGAAVGAL